MKAPFIELFRTPNNCYFLDVNKNELIPISEPSYAALFRAREVTPLLCRKN